MHEQTDRVAGSRAADRSVRNRLDRLFDAFAAGHGRWPDTVWLGAEELLALAPFLDECQGVYTYQGARVRMVPFAGVAVSAG